MFVKVVKAVPHEGLVEGSVVRFSDAAAAQKQVDAGNCVVVAHKLDDNGQPTGEFVEVAKE